MAATLLLSQSRLPIAFRICAWPRGLLTLANTHPLLCRISGYLYVIRMFCTTRSFQNTCQPGNLFFQTGSCGMWIANRIGKRSNYVMYSDRFRIERARPCPGRTFFIFINQCLIITTGRYTGHGRQSCEIRHILGRAYVPTLLTEGLPVPVRQQEGNLYFCHSRGRIRPRIARDAPRRVVRVHRSSPEFTHPASRLCTGPDPTLQSGQLPRPRWP